MTSIPWSIVDANGSNVRQRDPPLFQMPHMWQPNLHMTNPYHSSHCDRVQLGWQKWGAEHPDLYARRAEATEPDWYTRRVQTVQNADTKNMLWSHELTSKPTTKKTYAISRESPRPWQRGYQAQPHDIKGQIHPTKWGLYHPGNYQEPGRVEPLPPIHPNDKHF